MAPSWKSISIRNPSGLSYLTSYFGSKIRWLQASSISDMLGQFQISTWKIYKKKQAITFFSVSTIHAPSRICISCTTSQDHTLSKGSNLSIKIVSTSMDTIQTWLSGKTAKLPLFSNSSNFKISSKAKLLATSTKKVRYDHSKMLLCSPSTEHRSAKL